MRQIKTFSDSRLDTQCAYCGDYPENRDHVPSKILLDKPYPENLPVVPSCIKCNNGFSLDEAYFASLIECAMCGTTEIEKLSRQEIKKTLKYNSKLHSRLEKAIHVDKGIVTFNIETDRFENVLQKLAFGHIKYENSETEFNKPTLIWFKPVHLMTKEEELYFFSISELQKAPEVGSRGMQRMYLNENGVPVENWNQVQEDVYSYLVSISMSQSKVRLIIRNYLACEVIWNT
jgi:hypothetical protein